MTSRTRLKTQRDWWCPWRRHADKTQGRLTAPPPSSFFYQLQIPFKDEPMTACLL
ncbi:hypothetical protein CPB83DRAFT_858565 [Crepidotus variabilis]|uniref:Uncharacterized protein n=1 Tax=Crepidotus variabilis TaxID=179855 RepID=A0A9P6JMQ1_9AGAR|nr:hypothetical protein CPB83DRAFT_858565 [Crepidotus variabilis]